MTLFKRKQKMYVLAVSCLAITILSSCGDLQDETPDPETLDLFEMFSAINLKITPPHKNRKPKRISWKLREKTLHQNFLRDLRDTRPP